MNFWSHRETIFLFMLIVLWLRAIYFPYLKVHIYLMWLVNPSYRGRCCWIINEIVNVKCLAQYKTEIYIYVCVYVYICIYVCIYTCMCIYIYIYIYTHKLASKIASSRMFYGRQHLPMSLPVAPLTLSIWLHLSWEWHSNANRWATPVQNTLETEMPTSVAETGNDPPGKATTLN